MRTEVEAKYSFSVTKERNETVFRYRKTPFSYQLANTKLLFIPFVPAIIITFLIAKNFGFNLVAGFILWIVILLLMGFALTFLINSLRTRNTYEFRVTDTHIIIGNKSYDRIHINSFSKESYSLYKYSYDYNEIINASNGRILMTYGSKDIAIAKGLGGNDLDILYMKLQDTLKRNV